MDHGSVPKDGQVDPRAVIGHELGRQLADLVNEGFDQFFLGPLAHVRRADDLDLVTVGGPGSDERADADPFPDPRPLCRLPFLVRSSLKGLRAIIVAVVLSMIDLKPDGQLSSTAHSPEQVRVRPKRVHLGLLCLFR